MDNHRRGLVADFLKAKTKEGSRLSVVSAYFTIYAYEALKDHLDRIEHLDFLFGEPRFISSLDPDKTEKKAFKRANTTGDISTLEHKLDAKISRLYGLTPEEIKTVEESTQRSSPMPKDLYPKLCHTDTLRIALNYAFEDEKDDFAPDVLRHQDYLYNLDENLERLARSLSHSAYRPRPLREIDVPKTGLSGRPGTSLDIEDHIVFFGIAYLLAPLLDRVLPAGVFHFRVRKKGDRPHPSQLF